MTLATVELFRARRLGDLEAIVDRAGAMLRGDGGPVDPELRALALMNLGIAETWTLRLPDAARHLEEGLALGRRIGSPYVDVACLTALGVVANLTHRLDRAEELLGQAVAIAERVGWATHPVIAVAYVTLGQVVLDRGRVAEGERWLARADPILGAHPEPAANVALCHAQGMLAYFQGRHAAAAELFAEGERSIAELRSPHFLAGIERQWELRSLLAGGDPEPARAALDDRGEGAHWCSLQARVCLHDGEAAAASAAVAGVLAGEQAAVHVNL
jgi:LuxR family maltose regulon positive regulatory protein